MEERTAFVVSDPATTTRLPSPRTISSGISSFSAPSSSDCGGDETGPEPQIQGNERAPDTYKIIEQVLLFRTLLLSCHDPCETVFSYVLQVIHSARNKHNEPCKPWEVSDERKNPTKTFRTRRDGNRKEKSYLIPDSSKAQCPVWSPSRSISEPPPNAISFITSCLDC